MPRVFVLQHLAAEPLGTIGDALQDRGVEATYIRVFDGEPVPNDLNGAAGLVVMGGPMGVYEQHEYPFLKDEIRLIESALRTAKPVLGICLGSQLIASALGAEVKKARRKEIGWFPVSLTKPASEDRVFSDAPESFMGYHWHGDEFNVPAGTYSLARSAQTQCQAFGYGNSTYGFLFHLEATPGIIEAMTRGFSDELVEEKIDGDEIIDQTRRYLPEFQSIAASVFGKWASLIEG